MKSLKSPLITTLLAFTALVGKLPAQTLLNPDFDTNTTAEYTLPSDYTGYGTDGNIGWLPVNGNSPTGASGDDVFVNTNDLGDVNGLYQAVGTVTSPGVYTYTLGVGIFADQTAFTGGTGDLVLGALNPSAGNGAFTVLSETPISAAALATTLVDYSVSATLNGNEGDDLVIAFQDNGNEVGGGGSPSFAIDNGALTEAAIPEPSTYALLGAGLAGLAFMGRQRRCNLVR